MCSERCKNMNTGLGYLEKFEGLNEKPGQGTAISLEADAAKPCRAVLPESSSRSRSGL